VDQNGFDLLIYVPSQDKNAIVTAQIGGAFKETQTVSRANYKDSKEVCMDEEGIGGCIM
jgi:hypothetical protein